jgi:hypothetical protein
MNRKSLQPVLPALLLPFLAFHARAQAPAQDMTGYAHPDQSTINGVPSDHYVKPSHANTAAQPAAPAYQDAYPATAAVPAPAAEPALITRQPAPPATAPLAAMPAAASAQYAPYSPAQPIQTASLGSTQPVDDGIVLEVPTRPHELNRGTLLHARLREPLNTATTPEGAVFTAELTADVGHHGEIMLPAGSLIRGHVTSVHGGKRITGGAALHLRPETVSLPDGTLYNLNAQVTDLDSTQDLRVNDEGTVVLRSNPKAAAAVVGGVTATAAITGAMVGGGVGAGVGAIAGAGIATVVYLKREVQENIPAHTDIIFALDEPLVVTPR